MYLTKLNSRVRYTGSLLVSWIAPAHSRRRVLNQGGEPELLLLPSFASCSGVAIDVGAADGVYTARFIDYFSRCWAFEMRPDAARILRSVFRRCAGVSVLNVALSDVCGSTVMRTSFVAGGLSTIHEGNVLKGLPESVIERSQVEVRTLDSFSIPAVALIKIDVEGHEISVLLGGRATILDSRPFLIVESERRHEASEPDAVIELLTDLGYEGFFIHLGILHGIRGEWSSEFQMPNPDGSLPAGYVSNFVFTPRERVSGWLSDLRKSQTIQLSPTLEQR